MSNVIELGKMMHSAHKQDRPQNRNIKLTPFSKHPKSAHLFKDLVKNPAVMRYVGGVSQDEDLEAKIQEFQENPHAFIVSQSKNPNPKGVVAVRQSKDQDVLLVQCCFCNQIWSQKLADIHQISYKVHPQFQGQGVATSATTELLKLAFMEWGLPSVVALIRIENYGSIKVARKLGMELLGSFVYQGNLWEYHQIKKAQYLAQWFCE
jgi:RimJ/RimL family protein N-acetyltransferase